MEEEIRLIMAKDSWVETYEEICIAAALSNDFTVLAASSEENRQLNRYQDVYPYDHSRVLLKNVTKGTDYINASLVKNERACRRYILAQGPLQRTIGHFWSMVWHEKSSAILMLNRLIEKGVKKCEQYWPPNPGETILCPEVNLRVDSESSDQRTDYVLTSLYITDLKSGERRRILHFQYIMWPDFGVPRCPDSFLNFLEAVRKTGSLEEDVGPPVVHCSAGIGRSGTFCLVDTSLVLLAKDGPSSVILKDILLDLRNYRMGLIQTWEQLRFSYLAVVAGAKRDERISLKLFDDVTNLIALISSKHQPNQNHNSDKRRTTSNRPEINKRKMKRKIGDEKVHMEKQMQYADESRFGPKKIKPSTASVPVLYLWIERNGEVRPPTVEEANDFLFCLFERNLEKGKHLEEIVNIAFARFPDSVRDRYMIVCADLRSYRLLRRTANKMLNFAYNVDTESQYKLRINQVENECIWKVTLPSMLCKKPAKEIVKMILNYNGIGRCTFDVCRTPCVPDNLTEDWTVIIKTDDESDLIIKSFKEKEISSESRWISTLYLGGFRTVWRRSWPESS